ncbi:IS3 family transposase [Chryseobacterium limigenitum]|uniref:IS3 family transposase n=1 Tax=Chryseobacterium limigenitum TaxID=1612149 RepID=UPI001114B2CE|nr:IS3 family transposase [Chryseobacterium limigenitum]
MQSERRAVLSAEIFSIYHWSRCRYGSPRIVRELESKEIRASRPFVAKLMRESNVIIFRLNKGSNSENVKSN